MYEFPKSCRLRSAKDFENLRIDSLRYNAKSFRAFFKKNIRKSDNHSRLGFAVSKKVGNAVIRNRIKRLLRQWFRYSELKHKESIDIFITISPHLYKKKEACKAIAEKELSDDLLKLAAFIDRKRI